MPPCLSAEPWDLQDGPAASACAFREEPPDAHRKRDFLENPEKSTVEASVFIVSMSAGF